MTLPASLHRKTFFVSSDIALLVYVALLEHRRGTLALAIAFTNVGEKPLTRRDMDNLRKRGRGQLLAQRGLFDSCTYLAPVL
jgi:hypothetical protein